MNDIKGTIRNMDSGFATGPSTLKDKTSKRQKTKEAEDIISNLPESLISRILSVLPTKDAVRTCVLSKRWLYLWRLITKLEFNDSLFYSFKKKGGGKQHFINFVTRTLLLTHNLSMESFSLSITNKYDVSLLNTWISSILNSNLKNLCIKSYSELTFSALTSQSLFNSKLLEELVLVMFTCGSIKVLTSYVFLNHLILLKLSGITFTLDSSCNSRDLRLTFPVLKKFETRNCNWLNVKCVIFDVPLVESIFIEQNPDLPHYLSHCCSLVFSALHLGEFTYCGDGYMPQKVMMIHQSATNASASIILRQCKRDKVTETGDRAYQLLKKFSLVKFLKFEGLEVLTPSKVASASLPAFEFLTHLELGLVSGEVLLSLLQKSPVLRILIFEGLRSDFNTEILDSSTVPKCLQSTLQMVKFGNVHGLKHELCLAEFVMENGFVLERMSFSLASKVLGKSKVLEEFKEKLYSVKKGFNFVIVEFSYDWIA